MSTWGIVTAAGLYAVAAIDPSFIGFWALALIGCLYLFSAFDLARKRKYGLAFAWANYASSCVALMFGLMPLMFANYALANLGLVRAAQE